jgi:Chaperone of endosialidase
MGLGAGIAAAAATVLGAGISAYGSMSAANTQAKGEQTAANTNLSMYNQTRSDLLPYMNAGGSALSSLTNLYGLNPGGNSASMLKQLQQYPGYQFALKQGQQSLDASAAARGLDLSGGQLQATEQYGQGMADQLYGTYASQLSGLAGLGENAGAMTGTAGTSAAATAGGFQSLAGTAGASGIVGVSNSLTNALQNQSLLAALSQNNNAGAGSYFGTAQSMADMMSDRRLKTDIKPVGKLYSGLPIYSYRFNGSMLPQIGVMADEARKVAPHAVRRGADGFDRVNYGKLSELPPLRSAA